MACRLARPATALLAAALLVLAAAVGLAAFGSPRGLGGVLPGWFGGGGAVRVGPVRAVGAAPFVYEPIIAVHPTDDSRLAAAYITSSEFACVRASPCQIAVALATSADAGATWEERRLTPYQSGDPVVAYAPDGTLHVVALGFALGGSRVVLRRGPLAHDATEADLEVVALAPGSDKPWLAVARDTGELYVAYSATTTDGRGAVMLTRSPDPAKPWTLPVPVAHDLQVFGPGGQAATPPFGAQVLLGAGGSERPVAVAWLAGEPVATVRDDFVGTLRLATSSDGGASFGPAATVGEIWAGGGGFAGTARDGIYYLVYRPADGGGARLVVTRSDDGGATWATADAGGSVRFYPDRAPAPAIDVAPDGTVDVLFYAARSDCVDLAAWRRLDEDPAATYVDPCMYDVYYAYSTDRGASFSAPLRLNEAPLRGADFIRPTGFSRPGEYVGIASADRAAYPIWIAGARAYTARIER